MFKEELTKWLSAINQIRSSCNVLRFQLLLWNWMPKPAFPNRQANDALKDKKKIFEANQFIGM